MPKRQSEYLGIKLTDTMDEIKFRKGTAKSVKNDKTNTQQWTFDLSDYKYNDGEIEPEYLIFWKDNKIKLIACVAPKTRSFYCPEVNGISIGSNSETMLTKLGNEYEISINKDNTERIYSFKKYNAHFMLEKDKVTALGIFNPEVGTVHFAEEANNAKSK